MLQRWLAALASLYHCTNNHHTGSTLYTSSLKQLQPASCQYYYALCRLVCCVNTCRQRWQRSCTLVLHNHIQCTNTEGQICCKKQ
ncbi:hypothetical protein COO60DRAFT_1555137 [Scenedesmus sp. NREL 46B-D3]|nr:hypothetical protein COO60DRAFT_1555137 [Scenedesmus sp. NREL 46B-D3]